MGTTSDRNSLLAERLRQLPAEKWLYVEALLTYLEHGDASARSLLSTLLSAGGGPKAPGLTLGASAPSQVNDWPHAPLHRVSECGTYMVTAGTLHKEHWFRGAERLDLLESALLRLTESFGWQVEAWAVFTNHYHFVAHAGAASGKLEMLIRHLHGQTARLVNQWDNAPDRAIWHNYWDTRLTFEKSYLARLNYVHQNPVKHGLVPVANQYRWCSAAWFERTATRAQVKTIYSFKTDKVRVLDDFEPV